MKRSALHLELATGESSLVTRRRATLSQRACSERRLRALGSVVCLWLSLASAWPSLGCGARPTNARTLLPPPTEQTSVGPGDIFQLHIVGEKDLPTEFQVASDGTVDFPYLQSVRVAGLEPQEIARLVREGLVAAKILTHPSVVVTVKEYNSKRVTLLGQVQKPGSFPLSTGLTLLQAVSLAGGLTGLANQDHVNLTRKTAGGVRTVEVSVEAIAEGLAPDIPLQSGDQIYVHERIF